MVMDGSGGPAVGLGQVGMPSRRSGSGRKGPREGSGWNGRPSRRFVSSWEFLPKVRYGSRGSRGGPGQVGRPSRKFGRCREAHPDFRNGWECHLEVWDESKGPPGGSGHV